MSITGSRQQGKCLFSQLSPSTQGLPCALVLLVGVDEWNSSEHLITCVPGTILSALQSFIHESFLL